MAEIVTNHEEIVQFTPPPTEKYLENEAVGISPKNVIEAEIDIIEESTNIISTADSALAVIPHGAEFADALDELAKPAVPVLVRTAFQTEADDAAIFGKKAPNSSTLVLPQAMPHPGALRTAVTEVVPGMVPGWLNKLLLKGAENAGTFNQAVKTLGSNAKSLKNAVKTIVNGEIGSNRESQVEKEKKIKATTIATEAVTNATKVAIAQNTLEFVHNAAVQSEPHKEKVVYEAVQAVQQESSGGKTLEQSVYAKEVVGIMNRFLRSITIESTEEAKKLSHKIKTKLQAHKKHTNRETVEQSNAIANNLSLNHDADGYNIFLNVLAQTNRDDQHLRTQGMELVNGYHALQPDAQATYTDALVRRENHIEEVCQEAESIQNTDKATKYWLQTLRSNNTQKVETAILEALNGTGAEAKVKQKILGRMIDQADGQNIVGINLLLIRSLLTGAHSEVPVRKGLGLREFGTRKGDEIMSGPRIRIAMIEAALPPGTLAHLTNGMDKFPSGNGKSILAESADSARLINFITKGESNHGDAIIPHEMDALPYGASADGAMAHKLQLHALALAAPGGVAAVEQHNETITNGLTYDNPELCLFSLAANGQAAVDLRPAYQSEKVSQPYVDTAFQIWGIMSPQNRYPVKRDQQDYSSNFSTLTNNANDVIIEVAKNANPNTVAEGLKIKVTNEIVGPKRSAFNSVVIGVYRGAMKNALETAQDKPKATEAAVSIGEQVGTIIDRNLPEAVAKYRNRTAEQHIGLKDWLLTLPTQQGAEGVNRNDLPTVQGNLVGETHSVATPESTTTHQYPMQLRQTLGDIRMPTIQEKVIDITRKLLTQEAGKDRVLQQQVLNLLATREGLQQYDESQSMNANRSPQDSSITKAQIQNAEKTKATAQNGAKNATATQIVDLIYEIVGLAGGEINIADIHGINPTQQDISIRFKGIMHPYQEVVRIAAERMNITERELIAEINDPNVTGTYKNQVLQICQEIRDSLQNSHL